VSAAAQPPAAPGRRAVGGAAVAGLLALLAFDFAVSEPIDPFDQPPPAAFGSGQAPAGALCTGPLLTGS
jgi:hypothetical protein